MVPLHLFVDKDLDPGSRIRIKIRNTELTGHQLTLVLDEKKVCQSNVYN
jgi:hypothetical protein